MTILFEVLLGLVLASTVGVVLLWQYVSHGNWRQYPVGKAFMGLLMAYTLVFGLIVFFSYNPDLEYKILAYNIACILLLAAQAQVAWVIWSTHREHADD